MSHRVPAFLAFCGVLCGLSLITVTLVRGERAGEPRRGAAYPPRSQPLPAEVTELRAALPENLVVYYDAPPVIVHACPDGHSAVVVHGADGKRSPCS